MNTWFLLIVFALFSFASASVNIAPVVKEKVSFKAENVGDSLAVINERHELLVLELIFDSGGGFIDHKSNKGTYGISQALPLDFRQIDFKDSSYKDSIKLIGEKRSDCLNTIVHQS